MATLRLRITATAESILRSGHPWLFADSIREQNREGQTGELAVVFDRKDAFLAIGLYDSGSPIRVRILHRGKPRTIDGDWWRDQLRQSVDRRKDLFDRNTTGYRLINGESDGWPGLVLDRYDSTLVLKLYTAAWLPHLSEVAGLIAKELNPHRMVLRLSRNIQSATNSVCQIRDGDLLYGPAPDGPVPFLERGLQFEADVQRGQKTGFFLDQRENRRTVESLARDRELLNVFSHTGGFSVAAARGGAKSATDLDISAHALSGAARNFSLNQDNKTVAACRHRSLEADAFVWLETGPSERFDLIVLDPPSLAKREVERDAAIHAYGKLATLGIRRLRPGGILVAASCSAHVTEAEFFGAVLGAARNARRKFSEVKRSGHAEDHPATFVEAAYLKCVFLRFDS